MNMREWAGTHDSPEWDRFMELDGQVMLFNIHRAFLEEGKSFAPEALDAVFSAMKLWIGTRLMRMWVENGEPPVSVDVYVTIENAVKATDEAHRKWRDQ